MSIFVIGSVQLSIKCSCLYWYCNVIIHSEIHHHKRNQGKIKTTQKYTIHLQYWGWDLIAWSKFLEMAALHAWPAGITPSPDWDPWTGELWPGPEYEYGTSHDSIFSGWEPPVYFVSCPPEMGGSSCMIRQETGPITPASGLIQLGDARSFPVWLSPSEHRNVRGLWCCKYEWSIWLRIL